MSRNHLPTIFPWSCINKTPNKTQNLEDIAISTPTKKIKYDTELLNADEAKENLNALEPGFHEIQLNNLEELNPDDSIYIEQDRQALTGLQLSPTLIYYHPRLSGLFPNL